MTITDQSERAAAPVETAAWAGSMTMGIVLVILGIFCALLSTLTGLLTIIVLGAFFVAGGLAEVIAAFQVRRQRAFLVLGGILSIVVGVALLARPLAGLAAATLLLSAFFVAAGLFRAVTSVAERPAQWGWELAYGVLSIVLGIYLMAVWPVAALWLIGTLVGVELVVRGVSWIGASLLLRRVVHATGRFGRGPRTASPA